ncbi:hypothetical protein [Alysiella filiformis]|uniref:Uncharacterized protein n=1 Tax=Alysiella filiformis DSM 16848 TaxID=1120981 RepID=A0A286E979_9NEIS|nr:hypothetical protein [Alysiella filiformis]QMT30329.1 hypothetical protein H3L97_00575 [Alysiella filiformis]UBQ55544.1 hypothetical protein JF568_08100 [Alysiella filiformis DSM 16848]SOD67451.1 hypothetical protein SAMN02746062_00908 [Alysiella filiformis DSM 16848]
MLTLDLPPHIEQAIIHQAQGVSINELITRWAKQDDVLLTDFFKTTSQIAAFENTDPVAYQRAMRDE